MVFSGFILEHRYCINNNVVNVINSVACVVLYLLLLHSNKSFTEEIAVPTMYKI